MVVVTVGEEQIEIGNAGGFERLAGRHQPGAGIDSNLLGPHCISMQMVLPP